jgi:hypothetical protein
MKPQREAVEYLQNQERGNCRKKAQETQEKQDPFCAFCASSRQKEKLLESTYGEGSEQQASS